MNERQDNQRLAADLRGLRFRIVELEGKVQLLAGGSGVLPAAALTPSIWGHEIFPAKITGDNQDGTYQARRQISTAMNTFADDSDDTATITVGNVSERGGYTGELSVNDIVLVRFDGLTSAGGTIYHVW